MHSRILLSGAFGVGLKLQYGHIHHLSWHQENWSIKDEVISKRVAILDVDGGLIVFMDGSKEAPDWTKCTSLTKLLIDPKESRIWIFLLEYYYRYDSVY